MFLNKPRPKKNHLGTNPGRPPPLTYFFSIETPLFRQATFYLAELFRQATFYLAELSRQIPFSNLGDYA